MQSEVETTITRLTPEEFIQEWDGVVGSERSNAQIFVNDLCEMLGLEKPKKAIQDHSENAYVFERYLKEHDAEAKASNRFIDCYRRGCFVLEAKSVQINRESQGAQIALKGAHAQAQNYARSLPASEGRPPFLIVVDVGNCIELYSEFSMTGGNYQPFPYPGKNRIRIKDLAQKDIRDMLRQIWLDPLSLDPTKISAKVTRQISIELAELAKSLEKDGHDSHAVAGFLTRCLFTLFAEDVELIPKDSFTNLLESLKDTPEDFPDLIAELWQKMNTGGKSLAIRHHLIRFNGKFFHEPTVLPLRKDQINLLLNAARHKWDQVEPAIFGTLLERALDPTERHSLGAHYTPRSYVERLVLPTVIEPLRQEWENVQTAALQLHKDKKIKEAETAVRTFHHRLLQIRVLDPACGSANFLYVAMEHLKRLEGEVLRQLDDLGTSLSFQTEGLTVDPHQFLGIELNPRAAAIAEMVLWIGYLQWHFKTHGRALPPEPVLRDFRNIECRDAVLAWDDRVPAVDVAGNPITRWDGTTRKVHPVTGELVPDETVRVPVWTYMNPRQAEWPEADFIVGNPPFIGNKRMRDALGDGYTEALRKAWPEVPESADFVMYWWERAAKMVKASITKQFGLITTNSITQTFNRKVLEAHLNEGLHLVFAVPDHPWVENTDGAAVRIAMTVAAPGEGNGRLLNVIDEADDGGEGLLVKLTEEKGLIHPDVRIGANVASCLPLQSNALIANRGVIPHGEGMSVTLEEAVKLGLGEIQGLEHRIRPYRNGKDVTSKPRGIFVLDMYGLSADQVRDMYPAVFQHLLERVKPDRDLNPRASRRENWWLFAENQPKMRAAIAGLDRYLVTVQTSKHRFFVFLDSSIIPDDKLIAVGLNDAFYCGVLNSLIHVSWANAAGGWMGVGNDSVYNKTKCFDAFPFPNCTPDLAERIRKLGQQIDTHRKTVQEKHPSLTITNMYNVVEKLRSGEPLSEKEKLIHENALLSVLKSLHDELDVEVLKAYGWDDLSPLLLNDRTALSEAILERLVLLNRERIKEESQGNFRWLRPEFQNPGTSPEQQVIDASVEEESPSTPAIAAKPKQKLQWPAETPAQVAAIAKVLSEAAMPLKESEIADSFSGRGPWKKRLPELLETLVALSRARLEDGHYYAN